MACAPAGTPSRLPSLRILGMSASCCMSRVSGQKQGGQRWVEGAGQPCRGILLLPARLTMLGQAESRRRTYLARGSKWPWPHSHLACPCSGRPSWQGEQRRELKRGFLVFEGQLKSVLSIHRVPRSAGGERRETVPHFRPWQLRRSIGTLPCELGDAGVRSCMRSSHSRLCLWDACKGPLPMFVATSCAHPPARRCPEAS